jgi:hypothetical protein
MFSLGASLVWSSKGSELKTGLFQRRMTYNPRLEKMTPFGVLIFGWDWK